MTDLELFEAALIRCHAAGLEKQSFAALRGAASLLPKAFGAAGKAFKGFGRALGRTPRKPPAVPNNVIPLPGAAAKPVMQPNYARGPLGWVHRGLDATARRGPAGKVMTAPFRWGIPKTYGDVARSAFVGSALMDRGNRAASNLEAHNLGVASTIAQLRDNPMAALAMPFMSDEAIARRLQEQAGIFGSGLSAAYLQTRQPGYDVNAARMGLGLRAISPTMSLAANR